MVMMMTVVIGLTIADTARTAAFLLQTSENYISDMIAPSTSHQKKYKIM